MKPFKKFFALFWALIGLLFCPVVFAYGGFCLSQSDLLLLSSGSGARAGTARKSAVRKLKKRIRNLKRGSGALGRAKDRVDEATGRLTNSLEYKAVRMDTYTAAKKIALYMEGKERNWEFAGCPSSSKAPGPAASPAGAGSAPSGGASAVSHPLPEVEVETAPLQPPAPAPSPTAPATAAPPAATATSSVTEGVIGTPASDGGDAGKEGEGTPSDGGGGDGAAAGETSGGSDSLITLMCDDGVTSVASVGGMEHCPLSEAAGKGDGTDSTKENSGVDKGGDAGGKGLEDRPDDDDESGGALFDFMGKFQGFECPDSLVCGRITRASLETKFGCPDGCGRGNEGEGDVLSRKSEISNQTGISRFFLVSATPGPNRFELKFQFFLLGPASIRHSFARGKPADRNREIPNKMSITGVSSSNIQRSDPKVLFAGTAAKDEPHLMGKSRTGAGFISWGKAGLFQWIFPAVLFHQWVPLAVAEGAVCAPWQNPPLSRTYFKSAGRVRASAFCRKYARKGEEKECRESLGDLKKALDDVQRADNTIRQLEARLKDLQREAEDAELERMEEEETEARGPCLDCLEDIRGAFAPSGLQRFSGGLSAALGLGLSLVGVREARRSRRAANELLALQGFPAESGGADALLGASLGVPLIAGGLNDMFAQTAPEYICSPRFYNNSYMYSPYRY